MKEIKISENISLKKLEEQMKILKPFIWGAKALGKLGFKAELIERLSKEAPKQFKLAKELIQMPDRFNDHFVKLGWIAYESLNHETMKAAVDKADSSNIDEAENILVNFYTEEQITFLKTRLKSIPSYMVRMNLIDKILKDYLEGRYYSVVLVLLSLTDAMVADLSNNGLYTDSSNVTSYDSISGHEKGLKALKKILTKNRKKTNADPLYLPYRHGILHGRDLGYDNKILAAKCWSLLFAVGDWAHSLNNEPEIEEKYSLETLINQIYKTQQQKSAMKEWKPRKLIKSIDSSKLEIGTPEYTCGLYLDYLITANYGKAVSLTKSAFSSEKLEISKVAGELRAKLKSKTINYYKIESVEDQASAATNVNVKVYFQRTDEDEKVVSATIRLLYVDTSGETIPRNMGGGEWRIIYDAINSLEYSDLFLSY